LATSANAFNQSTTARFDPGSDTQNFSGGVSRVTTLRDNLGRATQVSQPYFVGGTPVYSVTSYDQLGRVTHVAYPDGSSASHAYHGLQTVDSDNSQTLTSTHDGQGEVVQTIDALGNVTTYEYDPFGHLQVLRDPGGNTDSWLFDIRGNRLVRVDPDTGNSFWNYDSLGELTSSRTPNEVNVGETTTYQYDLLGRKIGRTEPDLVSAWRYDPAGAIGRLAGATTAPGAFGNAGDGTYSRTHSYDSLARPIKTVTSYGGDVSFAVEESYDANGRLATVTNPSGTVIGYVYNSVGYLSQNTKTVPGGSATPYYTVNSRDAAGHPLSVSLGNAAFSNTLASTNVAESFSYDALNRLTNVAGPAPKSFAYDGTGNVTGKSDVGTYTYGPSGGTGPHQVKSIAGAFNATISYDADGNMLSDTGDGRTMSWTSFNQPATITQGGVTTTFSYDPEHRRIAMSSTTPVVTLYNWDDATGTYSTVVETAADYDDYLFAEGGVVGVQQTNVVNHLISTVYYHNDGLGSVIGLSNDAGAMVEKDGHDAWGKRRFATGADDAGDTLANSSETTRGFTQQEEVPQAGLVNLNARLYDPHLGRFLSADPIGHAGGPNLYAYGNNNPMRFTDPSGLAPTVSPARAAQIAAITAGNGPPGSPQFLDAHANFRSTIATISDGLQGNDVTFSSEGLLSGEISALQTGFSATSFAGSIDTFTLAPGVPFGGGIGRGQSGTANGQVVPASDLNGTSTAAAAAAQPTAGVGSTNSGGFQQASIFTSQIGVPFLDDTGNQVLDFQGNPIMRPSDVTANYFVDLGLAASQADTFDPTGAPNTSTSGLIQFGRGGPLDLQRVGPDQIFTPQFVDFSSVAIGLYAASANLSPSFVLNISNAVAANSHFAPGTVFDQTYTNLPIRNVYNTTLGFQLYSGGLVGPSPHF
jgi:RHS repeat-associated protein